ncbi:MAG TPA: hypothetical protein VD884_03675 [Ohtaekwangia sp.]|nr:hypothetical protein [Ohtaekwangia sp.]
MPHTWEHLNLTKIPFEDAISRIEKCLRYFEENLDGFEVTDAVYNFAFNASTPELEQYVLSRVRAVRTGGPSAINEIPDDVTPLRISCKSMGPGNIDRWVEGQVNSFLETNGGWLVLNTHGLDEERWGPVSSTYLTKLLKRLIRIDSLMVIPAGEVFRLNKG